MHPVDVKCPTTIAAAEIAKLATFVQNRIFTFEIHVRVFGSVYSF